MKELIFNNLSRFTTLGIFIIYAVGFSLWNSYLSRFGAFEYNLIQLRYLSAGILFCLTSIFVAGFIYLLYKHFYSKYQHFYSKKYSTLIIIGVCLLCIIGWIVLFTRTIFPRIPQYLGGAKPIRTTIIGSPEQISYLNNFDIPSADNSNNLSVQTFPVCLIYQNDDYFLFFNASNITESTQSSSTPQQVQLSFNSRAILLDRKNFQGLQAISNEYAET